MTVTRAYLSVGDGITSDYLDLMSAADTPVPGYRLQPPASNQPAMHSGGTVTFPWPIIIYGASSDDLIAKQAAIRTKLRQAKKAAVGPYGSWVSFGLGVGAATNLVYFDVLDGDLTLSTVYPANWARGVLTLTCLPYARADSSVCENYLLQTAVFDNAAWTKTRSSVSANATAAPNGATVADKLVEDATATSTHFAIQTVTPSPAIANGQTWTAQVYAKAAERTQVELAAKTAATANTTWGKAIFNLATGAVTSTANGTASMTDAGNGWYLCAVTGTLASISTDTQLSLACNLVSAGSDSYSGGGSSGLYLWGAQLAQSPRPAPYLENVSARALTNSGGPLYVYGVPGDADALVRATLATTAARVRLARRSGPGILTTDWSPWVDAPHATGAADTGTGAFNTTYATRSISTAAWSNIATVAQPSGARQTGPLDLWARVRDTPVAISTPTSLAGVITDGTATGASTYAPPSIVQTKTTTITGKTTSSAIALTPTATVVGNFLVAVIGVRDAAVVDGNTYSASSIPAGWTQLDTIQSRITGENGQLWMFARENSASLSTSQSWTITRTAGTGTWDASLIFHEIGSVATSSAITALNIDNPAVATPQTLSIATRLPNELVLGHIWGIHSGGNVTPNFYMGGVTEITTAGAVAAWSASLADASSLTAGFLYASIDAVITAYLALSGLSTVVYSGTGSLAAGSYVTRVQAVDTSGSLSNATASVTKTVTNGAASIAYTWSAGSGGIVAYYRLTVSAPDGMFYAFNTPDSTPAYTLTDLSLGTSVAALPATSGAVASFNRFRATLNGVATDPNGISVGEFGGASGSWYVLHFGTLNLPAADRAQDGTLPTWSVTIQGFNAGGGAAALDVDALVLLPHDEPQLTLETPDLSAADGYLVGETQRRASYTVAWQAVSDPTTPSDLATPAGVFTLAPTDNLIGVALATVAGVSDLTLTMTPSFTIWPRWVWQRGAS